jgi:ATP-dependent exoDNAse (exonuclease V) alpha subunit
LELVKTRIPNRFGLNQIRDIQVLYPMNRGGVGARSLNVELQAALNPAGERKVERFGWTFAPGDKVMQIENDYDKEAYNGDIGYIEDVDPEAGELSSPRACRRPGRARSCDGFCARSRKPVRRPRRHLDPRRSGRCRRTD